MRQFAHACVAWTPVRGGWTAWVDEPAFAGWVPHRSSPAAVPREVAVMQTVSARWATMGARRRQRPHRNCSTIRSSTSNMLRDPPYGGHLH